MSFIGILEDARIEYNAILEFPELKKLWRALLTLEYDEAAEHPSMTVLERLALMLLDSDVQCDDTELNDFAARFHGEIEAHQDDGQFSWHMGLELFNLFSARKEVPSLRILERIRIPYRDDNRFVWEFEELTWEVENEYVPASQRQVRRQVSVMEMANEVLPVVKNTPVLAGVCGTDPFRVMELFLKQVKEVGFSGVQNFPTVGLIDGTFRASHDKVFGLAFV